MPHPFEVQSETRLNQRIASRQQYMKQLFAQVRDALPYERDRANLDEILALVRKQQRDLAYRAGHQAVTHYTHLKDLPLQTVVTLNGPLTIVLDGAEEGLLVPGLTVLAHYPDDVVFQDLEGETLLLLREEEPETR